MNSQFYIGIVESRDDPLKSGRVQVRVFGIHSESRDDIPTSSLPWAVCIMPATSASISGLGYSPTMYVEGTMVFVFFQDGESKQHPIVVGSVPAIPLNHNSFSGDYTTEELTGSGKSTNNSVGATATGTLLDSAGQPVIDETGNPIQAGETISCCSSVDTQKLVGKYGENVNAVCSALCNAGIKDPYAIIAILSNIAKESGFMSVRENMSYSSVSRLKTVFPSKFSSLSDDSAAAYVNNPELLANFVYSNKNGNGQNDGFKYRGGGFIQLTFANNYKTVGSAIGVDLLNNPDKINEPTIAAKAAAQYFISRFGGANRLKFSSLDEALFEVTKKVNPGGLMDDLPKVKAMASLCSVLNEAEIQDKKQEESTAAKPNDPENDVDRTATKTDIDSGTTRTSRKISNLGFSDPKGKYPTQTKEQDTHRLSRRNTSSTNVSRRMDNLRKGIRSIGGSFDEPQPAYNAKYPFNHVYATESGHNLEFDDTPGAERVNLYHSSGTYTEIDKFGNQVNKIIGDSFSITERNGYVYIDGTARVTVSGNTKLIVGGSLDVEVDGDVNWNIGGDVNWNVGGSMNSKSLGNNTTRSNGTIAHHASTLSSRSDGDFSIDASMIYMQSGFAASIDSGGNARSANDTDYQRQVPENFLGAEILEIDDADEEEVASVIEKSIANGTISRDDIDRGKKLATEPITEDNTEVKDKELIPSSCEIFNKTISDSTQISKYFTLGMLSSNTAVSNYKIVDNNGLTATQIACNLKSLAENTLDKIKEQYPKMMVTSGFRTGSGSSQHTLGQAADIQFPGYSKGDYYDIAIWIRDNVAFDKLLLEYKTTGTGMPWIHVTFKQSGNSKSVFTYMNHSNVGSGLKKLEQ